MLPGNIVCLEKEGPYVSEIKASAPGVDVRYQSFGDFVRTERDLDYQIVSLDFCGPLTWHEIDALNLLLKRQKSRSMVLHVANLVKRDSYSTSIYSTGLSALDFSYTREGPRSMQGQLERRVGDFRSFHAKRESGESQVSEKRYAFSRMIRAAFGGLGINEDSQKRIEDVIFFLSAEYRQEVIEMTRTLYHTLGGDPALVDPRKPFTSLPPTITTAYLTQIMFKKVCDACVRQILNNSQGNPRDVEPFSDGFSKALLIGLRDDSFYVDYRRAFYSYISESGAPMTGDVYFLRKPYKLINATQEFLRMIGYPSKYQVKDFRKLCLSLTDFSDKSDRLFNEAPSTNIDEQINGRVFLGSSAKGKKKFSVLTVEERIDALDLGIPESELTEQPVQEAQTAPDAKYVFSENEKQRIRDMRQVGATIEDIHATFPAGTATRSQVGAVAAWVKIRERKGETK
jgi:hypothetical protein